jgi:glycosyltransferase involved in cell wall biosynthesis
MKKILFYYPPNTKTVALESLIAAVKNKGYSIEVLTLSASGKFHDELTKIGVPWKCFPFAQQNSISYYLKQSIFLYKFCKKNKYDVVWSHLQPCNFSAVLVSFFIKARVIIFRHHFHAIIKQEGLKAVNKNERVIEKIICTLAKEIVVPSSEVYNGMVNYEKVNPNKIKIIPYMYNFNGYTLPNAKEIEEIKKQYTSKLLLIMVSRLIPMKRHNLVFPVFNKLIKEGYDVKVIVMDNGEEKEALQNYVAKNELSENIFFKGFVINVLEYMAAADVLIHPSFTDASSSALKEMGILGKPVMVCENVGDVNEYILHNKNGWVVKEENEGLQFEEFIKQAYNNPTLINTFGSQLKKDVLEKFSLSDYTLAMYETKIN